MQILSGLDIEFIDFSRECVNETRNSVVIFTGESGVPIRCVIGARVLLKENCITPSKEYKIFLADSNLQQEGQNHYISNPRITSNSTLSGFIIDRTHSIISSNLIQAKVEDIGKEDTYYTELTDSWYYKERSPEFITGYQGTFTGVFGKMDAFVPGISDYTVTVQPMYNPGDTLITAQIGNWKEQCGHISYGKISIPINTEYFEYVFGIKFIEGQKYTFDCTFGNDEGWGYVGYSEYAELPYLSGIIVDSDFPM